MIADENILRNPRLVIRIDIQIFSEISKHQKFQIWKFLKWKIPTCITVDTCVCGTPREPLKFDGSEKTENSNWATHSFRQFVT